MTRTYLRQSSISAYQSSMELGNSNIQNKVRVKGCLNIFQSNAMSNESEIKLCERLFPSLKTPIP